MGHPDYVYTPRTMASRERQRASMLRRLGIPDGYRRVYGHFVPMDRAAGIRERAAKLAKLRGFGFASDFVAMMLRSNAASTGKRQTMVPVVCRHCGVTAMKPLGTVNASLKRGLNLYCGRECSAEGRRKRTPEMRAEYMRLYREANRAKARRYARDYRDGKRGTERQKVLEMQRASYRRHRETNLRRLKEYRERNYPKIKASIERWLAANPDKKDLYAAKANLSHKYDLKVRDIPDDLALALVEQWRIKREIRKLTGK